MAEHTARLTHHDLELEVTYDFARAERPEGEQGYSLGYPGAPAEATVTAVHVVDPVVQQLRRALAAVLPYAESRIEDMADHAETACATLVDRDRALEEVELLTRAGESFDRAKALLAETRDHVGPALSDDWFDDSDRRSFEAELVQAEADADADAKAQHDEDAYEAAREAAGEE